MKNALIEIKVPGAGCSFEVNIPLEIRISELTEMLISALDGMTDSDFCAEGAVLCDGITGEVIDINKTVWKCGITAGSSLLLI